MQHVQFLFHYFYVFHFLLRSTTEFQLEGGTIISLNFESLNNPIKAH